MKESRGAQPVPMVTEGDLMLTAAVVLGLIVAVALGVLKATGKL